MSFFVEHGGYIRKSAIVSANESATFTAGRVLKIDTVGQWLVHAGTQSTSVAGTFIAFDSRVSTNTGPTTTVTKVGAPTGERISAIFDNAVLTQTDNLESGVDFDPGNKIYVSTNGKLTVSGNTTGPNSPVIGVALSDGAAGDNARPLTWFFSVTY